MFSDALGISVTCDVVGFHPDAQGITLPDYEGSRKPYPVEYKRGSPKANHADQLQLCVQALCLEEMLLCDISEVSLYYGETRRREIVPIDGKLRGEVCAILAQMHHYAGTGHTLKDRRAKSCNACSLRDLCLPQLEKMSDVSACISRRLEDG